MVPRIVLTRFDPISLNTARLVNTIQPRTAVNNAEPIKNVINNAYSTARRPFNKITAANNSNFTKKVNTVKGTRVNTARPKAVLSVVKGNKGNAVKASACWVWRPKHKGNPHQDLKDKGVIDSGCSRHMTGNKSYLTDYEEINGGFVAFGGNSKGGKITGKGKIRTGKLDFEDVYFVKELKFNLFSVSQMCDKKNSVLFTDTECVVLSPDFKLTDESHVLLKVPRKDNMYSVDLKNVIPQGGLTCLFAKATPDESNLWHRRLGHVNFKTMNKLVRGSLVRGLPSKLFEINQTCVACQKGKQHRASCKTKTVSSISQPLQMLHMDLFGPTFVKSLMKKMHRNLIDLGKAGIEDEKKDAEYPRNKDSEVPSTEEPRVNQEKDASVHLESRSTQSAVKRTVASLLLNGRKILQLAECFKARSASAKVACHNEHQLTFNQLLGWLMLNQCLKKLLDTHVVVWMNKPDFDTMGLDDLYNKFKIVEQKVKRYAAVNNDDKNLAFLTTSSPSSTNTINTVNTGVVLAQNQVNTASTENYKLHDDDFRRNCDLSGYMALLSYEAISKFLSENGRSIIDVEAILLDMRNQRREGLEEVLITEGHKEYLMGLLKTELEKVKEEKEGFEFKIAKFEKSSKDLDQLLASQITDKSKKGFGYNVVPSPHPLILNRPTPLDLSYSGLQEFKQQEWMLKAHVWKHSPFSDFKDFDRGYVTFGGGANGGKITGKGTFKIDKLDFEDVYFVKELKFNLFSVSQMCDKKNYVLFTDSEYLVLSPNFKLPDENQTLLKILRQNSMYSFDMKNIVPKDGLTCLVAKATSEESMLWHRRLGHVNFKNINKLVKENLVRDLPLKRFENDQTCVTCLKGKQHRVSCKPKAFSPITKPLFMLHMDLFGPTFVSSVMHKKYCLVVTDDYSRFSWVFFLKTKEDENCVILKNFIKEIENLVDKKVKIIRSDNGTKFKNHVMDEFCREKGIKREYSVARTPQQNGVAERKNRTLIEAARTMLADSKLPTTFWAEAVSTACYVQNRVLVVKPHNKTPYELFRGIKPAIGFMKPFGCHVTILNTLDKLGKFDGKSDEGFFVGYSLSSKAGVFRKMVPSGGIQGVSESSTSTQQDQDYQDGTHDDCSFQDNGIDDQQVNTASPQVNTGSREVCMMLMKTCLKGHMAYCTKWVYRNKKDERGIVIRNKAKTVAQDILKKRALIYDEVNCIQWRDWKAYKIILA
ncbi:putative ribonuclease H-like domain-containing protein [Tanacetum coccineum]|uniref:Ribonuclease H-like domain-containing protein n=1 Tax=Tanacetum coccineum TaxID=301880 RepID=A0ABQ5DCY5_9ASTR